MNQQILARTEKKLKENQEIGTHTWVFHGQHYTREYVVLPGVFSPAIFLGTQWLTLQILKRVEPQQSFLEIGCGAGVTSIQLYLNKGNKIITCSDINPSAIETTKKNSKTHNAPIQIHLSNLYTSLPASKYCTIYWNYPFHPSQKQYNTLTMLQKAVRDPGYQILAKFLMDSIEYLEEGGRIYLGFSLLMGDLGLLGDMCGKYGWTWGVVGKMGGDMGTICLVELRRK